MDCPPFFAGPQCVALNLHRYLSKKERDEFMLWTLLAILIVMWALGLGFGVAGNLIHILLLVAFVVLILNLVQGRPVA